MADCRGRRGEDATGGGLGEAGVGSSSCKETRLLALESDASLLLRDEASGDAAGSSGCTTVGSGLMVSLQVLVTAFASNTSSFLKSGSTKWSEVVECPRQTNCDPLTEPPAAEGGKQMLNMSQRSLKQSCESAWSLLISRKINLQTNCPRPAGASSSSSDEDWDI